MLDGGSVTGMIDHYARLWHCSSTIFYYPHCLVLEAIVRRLMILYKSGVAAKIDGGKRPGQTDKERECPTRLGRPDESVSRMTSRFRIPTAPSGARGVERANRRAAILLARDQVPNCMMEGGKRG